MKIKSIITAIVLSAVFLLSNVANAQRNDNLIRVDDVFNGNRDLSTLAATSFVLGGAQGEDPTAPLGSGLLILTAAGAGYVVAKRKRSIRTGGTLLISCAMLLSLTQCKKNIVAPESTGEGVHISLTVGYNGDRTGFTPSGDGSTGSFVWTNDATEYLYVGSENKGYIGSLSGTGNGTNQMTFEGTLTKTPATDEKMYFFYLGNGEHPDATSISFANQDGSIGNVTNYHVAISDAIPYNGEGPYGSAEYPVELKMKMAIAKFDLSGFGDETVFIHGDNVYAKATINWNQGTIVGEDYYDNYNKNHGHGYIEIPTPSAEVYVALIPTNSDNSDDPTTVKFDSKSMTNSKVFLKGIKAGKYYSNSGGAIEITGNELPAGTLKGLYTIDGTNEASTRKIRFSQGNLQYQPSTGYWRMATNQWDYIGYTPTAGTYANQHFGNVKYNDGGVEKDCNNMASYPDGYTSWIDLFGWGSASNPTSNTPADQTDNSFGEKIGEGWRLLSAANTATSTEEWQCLMSGRNTFSWCTGDNMKKHFGRGTVNGAKGLILLPDDWNVDRTDITFKYENNVNTNTKYGDNTYSETTSPKWSDMVNEGCVFLPVTGYCSYPGGSYSPALNGLLGDYPQGYYWSNNNNENNGYYMYFMGNFNGCENNAEVKCNSNNNKAARLAVRLVRDIN